MSHINVEIKACIPDGNRTAAIQLVRDKLYSKLDKVYSDRQIDTYYNVPEGRLKLREGTVEKYLIHYLRPNQTGPKKSDVSLVKMRDDAQCAEMKLMLSRLYTVKVVVDKQRDVFFVGNVKLHFDTVAGLGVFVEIEAIDKENTIGEKRLTEQCQEFLDILGIQEKDLISLSYSDMLLEKRESK